MNRRLLAVCVQCNVSLVDGPVPDGMGGLCMLCATTADDSLQPAANTAEIDDDGLAVCQDLDAAYF